MIFFRNRGSYKFKFLVNDYKRSSEILADSK